MKWRGRPKSSNIIDRRPKTVIKQFVIESIRNVKPAASYRNSYNKFK